MQMYYIYMDPATRQYEIYQTREDNLIGKYEGEHGKYYYFAAFSRLIDASAYVKSQNERLRMRY